MTTFHPETYFSTFLGTVRHCMLVIIQEKVGHIGVTGGGLGHVVRLGVVGEGVALLYTMEKYLFNIFSGIKVSHKGSHNRTN